MIKWTNKSLDDLELIYNYISKNFNQEKAFQVVEEIIETTESVLKENPLAGLLLESNPLFSKLIVSGNNIYYTTNPQDHSIFIVYVQAKKNLFDKKRIKKHHP